MLSVIILSDIHTNYGIQIDTFFTAILSTAMVTIVVMLNVVRMSVMAPMGLMLYNCSG
jgi:hypothetical protein